MAWRAPPLARPRGGGSKLNHSPQDNGTEHRSTGGSPAMSVGSGAPRLAYPPSRLS